MPDRPAANAQQRRGPKPGRLTPRYQITSWDRTSYTELRFSELTERIRDAEQGKVERWADTTRRMLKSDPDLVSVVNTRLDRAVAGRYEIAAPEFVPEGTSDLADEAAEFAEAYCFRELPDFDQVARDLLDAIGMGYSVAEIIWHRRQIVWRGRRIGIWAPQDIVAVHPRRFSFTEDFRLALREDAMTRAAGLDGDRVVTRDGVAIILPPDKYIVHQPRNILDYPTSTGLYMAIARQWWVKQWVTKYWLSGAEKAANPRPVGKYPQAAPDEVKADLFDALEAMAGDGIGVFSKETEVEFLQGNFAAGAQIWDQLAQRMAAMYAKAWLGSTLNVEIGETGGNRAAAESQADTTMDPRAERDGRALWGDLRRHLIEPFIRFNSAPLGDVFDRRPPVPVGRYVIAEEPVTVDAEAINAGVVTVNELRESRGLAPWAGTEGDRIVQPLGPTSPALPPLPRAEPDAPVPGMPDAPAAPEGLEPAGADVQSSALNGAQVTSMVEIVRQVAEGLLPRQTAIEIIVSAFPIDRAQAERILGDVGQGFRPKPPDEEVAETPAPFAQSHGPKPWDLATRLARSISPAAAATSTRSPTTPRGKKR